MSGSHESHGVRLRRTDEQADAVDALADVLGGRVGFGAVLSDLDRRSHRAPLGRLAGRAVHRAYGFDAADRRTPRWWPQGVSTPASATPGSVPDGRPVVATSWYAKGTDRTHQGVRITFLDTAALRYRHVLVVVPRLEDDRLRLEPLRVHAGGIAWFGSWLHVAATGRGFASCRLDDVVRVPDDLALPDERLGINGRAVASYGYRYLLPVRLRHRADADEGTERLRYSFLSVDRDTSPPELVVGEYGRGRRTRRLARFALDPDTGCVAADEAGCCRPLSLLDGAVAGMQGVAVAHGRHHITASHGPWTRGSVYAGTPGDLRRHRRATPMGPEDLDHDPATDLLWTVTEHPRRRWLVAMRASWFGVPRPR